MEEFYKLSINECFEKSASSIDGLKKSQITEKFIESQKYAIKPEKRQPFIFKFFSQIIELMVLILLVAGIVSIVIGVVKRTTGEIVDGAIILGIVFVNALFGALQERKGEKAVESLKKLSQDKTFVFRDGKMCKINTSNLVIGDVVYISAGSIVPADLRLVETTNLMVNESSITGESEAVEKDAQIVYDKDIQLAERKNYVFQSSLVESGHAKGLVEKIGTQTEIGKIAQTIKETKKDLTPLQKNIKSIGKILTYIVLLVAAVTFVLEIVANPNDLLNAFLTAIAISVAAIPESLPAVITIIMSIGIAKLSKQKAIVKRMHTVETLGACDVICSDKTGTITQNKMIVEKTFMFFKKESKFFELFVENMALCNDVEMGESGFVGSATEVALANYAKKFSIDKTTLEEKYNRLDEKPFNSQNKYMITLNKYGEKNICFCKGALDRILEKSKFFASESEFLPLDEKTKKKIFSENKKMCDDALRVIAFAYKITDNDCIEEDEFVFLGLCGIEDPPRPEVLEAVEKCKSAGMRPVMITGDYKDTAFAIAKKVGIAKNENEVISGQEIDLLDDNEFFEIVSKKNVFARVSPSHKTRIVEALKKQGHIVAMTGDGVNDAPSMKKASIGIGMGKTGTDVTKNVADIVVSDDNFATIVVAVEEGRKIYSNIQKTIKYLFSANMAEIFALFLITIILPHATFLFPVQILFVNLITDSLPAIALGTEKSEKGIMKEKPRLESESILSKKAGISVLVLGCLQTLLTLVAYFIGLHFYGNGTAITMAFYTLNLLQLFFMFTARTNESIFKSNPFKNKFFDFSLIFGFGILAVIATTEVKNVMKLVNLSLDCWIIVLLLSVSVIVFGEIYKAIEKRIFKKNCIRK